MVAWNRRTQESRFTPRRANLAGGEEATYVSFILETHDRPLVESRSSLIQVVTTTRTAQPLALEKAVGAVRCACELDPWVRTAVHTCPKPTSSFSKPLDKLRP